MNDNLKNILQGSEYLDNINSYIKELDNKFKDIDCSIKEKEKYQEINFMEKYKEEMLTIKREYKEMKENNNEEKLMKKLENEKEEINNKRENILQNTIRISKLNRDNKEILKKLKNESSELDEELEFLLNQINQANSKNDILNKEIEKNKDELEQFDDIDNFILKKDLINLLPYSIKNNYQNINQILGILPNKIKSQNNKNYDYINSKLNLNENKYYNQYLINNFNLESLIELENLGKEIVDEFDKEKYIGENILINFYDDFNDSFKQNKILIEKLLLN